MRRGAAPWCAKREEGERRRRMGLEQTLAMSLQKLD